MKNLISMFIAATFIISCGFINVSAADYTFKEKSDNDFYKSTNYEDVYGSEYNYGGSNVIDFENTPTLGMYPSTQMVTSFGTPGASSASGTTANMGPPVLPSYDNPTSYFPDIWTSGAAHTPAGELVRSDGSIGTLDIPILSISMKVYEGATVESMNKGVGHFPDSSGWNGNIALCGHNRGAKYNIGTIKDLQSGDVIRYSTIHGTRLYAVTYVGIIANNDWTYISATADNRITIITCLADQPSKRVCIQALEIL